MRGPLLQLIRLELKWLRRRLLGRRSGLCGANVRGPVLSRRSTLRLLDLLVVGLTFLVLGILYRSIAVLGRLRNELDRFGVSNRVSSLLSRVPLRLFEFRGGVSGKHWPSDDATLNGPSFVISVEVVHVAGHEVVCLEQVPP